MIFRKKQNKDDQIKKKRGIKINKKHVKNSRQGRTKCNITNKRRFWKHKFTSPSQLILCNLELNTGDHEIIPVKVVGKSFTIYGKRYLVNEEFLYFNRTFKMWYGDYHEDCSIQIQRKLPAQEIKQKLQDMQLEVVNNVNPKILEEFTTSEVIQKVFQGQEMEGIFRFLKIMVILILIASGGTLALVLSSVA